MSCVGKGPLELDLLESPRTTQNAQAVPNPLVLLLRVNVLTGWRRLKAIREQSRLLTTIIVLFITGYLVVSFWLFSSALNFLSAFPGLGVILTERLLYLLFAFLFGMLLLSSLVICYSNFFRNREANYLMSLPVSSQTIFRWKFIESSVLASWGFIFLIAPLLLAFGLSREVPWHFYGVTLMSMAAFIILPSVAGAWMAMQFGRHLDRRAFQLLLISLGAVALAVAVAWWRTNPTDQISETRVLNMLDQLLVKTRFAQFPFLPSYWLSSSILQWADGVFNTAIFFILVLLSNTAFFGLIAFTQLGRRLHETASAVHSRESMWGQWEWFKSRRAQEFDYRSGLAERVVGALPRLRQDTRALIVKDMRTFWRDTAQWGQAVVLFGLLAVYILNLRHFTHQLSNLFWVNLVSHLNLLACSLNLATVTTRFVFPQFSLEGRRLWIIGMAPMGLARAVKTKYWLASVASLAVTLSLITTSSVLLKMSWGRIIFFAAVVGAMSFSLNGLAMGVGVLYPNFKEANPSKIVSGFGGTLCLVLSFLYILASVLVLGFGASGALVHRGWVTASVITFLLLSALIGWVPLRLGFQHLSRLEI
jgi:ABC-2 type transport system permease protein